MTRTKKEILSHVTKEIEHSKIVANNTIRIKYKDGTEAIRLHDTDIVTFDGDEITLDSGGWQTVTTKDRMSSFSPVRLSQKNGAWYVMQPDFSGVQSAYYDGITIDREGKVISKLLLNDETVQKEVRRIKREIRKFTALITKDNLPQPRPETAGSVPSGIRTAKRWEKETPST